MLTALRAYKPELTPDQAEQLLLSAADTARAGKVINVAAAFRAAGLGAMVDGYHPPPPQTPPTPAVITVGTICPDGGVLSCQKPKLADGKRKPGKVILTVASLPPGAFLQARVKRRWHTSTSSSITLNAKHWKKIQLRFASIDGEHSHTLTVKPRTLRKLNRKHHRRR